MLRTNLIIAAVLALLSGASACSVENGVPDSKREIKECSFPVSSGDQGQACGVSILSLILSPKESDGKRIHTVAYLQVADVDGDYYLAAPASISLEASDLYSCVSVRVDDASISDNGTQPKLAPGIYVVDMVGQFNLDQRGWCVGTLSESRISVRWRVAEEDQNQAP